MSNTTRICPECGSDDIQLSHGGYMGAVYHCPNCQYTGPLVVDAESGQDPKLLELEQKAMSDIQNLFARVGFVAGLAFIVIGLLVGLSPVPFSERYVASFGLGIFILGIFLVAVLGLLWLKKLVRIEGTPEDRTSSKPESGPEKEG